MPNTPAIAAIDVDDVLCPLNEHVAKIAGIDYDKIVTFHTMDNHMLTDPEKQRLYAAYATPGMHRAMGFYHGTKELAKALLDPRIDPWICSNSLDSQVIADKKQGLMDLWGEDYSRFTEHFTLATMDTSREKKFPPGVWLIMDDSPLNVVASGARRIVMPEKPWNTSGWGMSVLEPVLSRVIFYRDLYEAADIIRTLADKDLSA